jgi:hypothetical protein
MHCNHSTDIDAKLAGAVVGFMVVVDKIPLPLGGALRLFMIEKSLKLFLWCYKKLLFAEPDTVEFYFQIRILCATVGIL